METTTDERIKSFERIFPIEYSIEEYSSLWHRNAKLARITVKIETFAPRSEASLYSLVQHALRAGKFKLVRKDGFLENFPLESEIVGV